MKKTITILFMLVACAIAVNAAMNPELKECMQRGYETKASPHHETVCIFPDGTNCTLADFNQGNCGQEFMIDDYCVEEGMVVWDSDRCCTGTEAYLPPQVAGQASCQKVSIMTKASDLLWYNPLMTLIVILAIIGAIIWFIRRK